MQTDNRGACLDMGAPDITCGPKADAIRSFRKRCIENGYKPIPVRSQSKQPVGKQWQQGASEERLLAVEPKALNTGILAAGLQCFDVDVDDPHVADLIEKLIRERFPGATVRRRVIHQGLMIVARAAGGEPGKRSRAGHHGKLEVLGTGQQFVAHGEHPSGASYEWENSRGPDTVPVKQLPAATEQQVDDLLNECAFLLGSLNSTSGAADIGKSTPGLASPTPHCRPTSASSLMSSRTSPLRTTSQRVSNGMTGSANSSPRQRRTSCKPVSTRWTIAITDPRDTWLRVLLAAADAERLGCPDARRLARSGRNVVHPGRVKAISRRPITRLNPSRAGSPLARYFRWRPRLA